MIISKFDPERGMPEDFQTGMDDLEDEWNYKADNYDPMTEEDLMK